MNINPSSLHKALMDDCLLVDSRVQDDAFYEAVINADNVDVFGLEDPVLYVQAARQFREMYSKLRSHRAPDAGKRAVEQFLVRNALCDRDYPRSGPVNDLIEAIALRVQTVLRDFSVERTLDMASMGPGASVQSKGRNSQYEKLFDADLTTTSADLYREYLRYIAKFPLWRSAEALRYEKWGEARTVQGSLLTTVPKKSEIDRTICTEPSLNMFWQLGIGRLIAEALGREYGLFLDVQPDIHQETACWSSVCRQAVTLDLKDASNCIPTSLVKRVLPADWYAACDEVRSKQTLVNGKWVELHMFSSMGNGFTFPLMTLIFTALLDVLAVESGLKRREAIRADLRFGVFGDDIIVPTSVARRTVEALEALGFEINPKKSFITGFFRESCGGDYFFGHDVKPCRIKSLGNVGELYSAINRVVLWCARTGIKLPRTLCLLADALPRNPHFVPLDESADAGLRTPLSLIHEVIANPDLFRGPTTVDLRRIRVGQYTKMAPKERKFQLVFFRKGLQRLITRRSKVPINIPGFLISFIEGWVRGGAVSRRAPPGRSSVYATEEAVTVPALWDCQPPSIWAGIVVRQYEAILRSVLIRMN